MHKIVWSALGSEVDELTNVQYWKNEVLILIVLMSLLLLNLPHSSTSTGLHIMSVVKSWLTTRSITATIIIVRLSVH